MLAIWKKELWSFYGNWGTWLVLAAFSVVCSLFLFYFENSFNIFDIGMASLQSYFVLVPWLLIFLIPAISMRSFAEEQQNGTLQWLFSQPLNISDIVCGKFFAVWLTAILCVLPSAVYFFTVYFMGVPEGNLDTGMTLGSYMGVFLLTGAFSALGILTSAISSNQITAYIIGVFLCFIFYFGIQQLASYRLSGNLDFILQNAGFYEHFNGFTRGLADSRDIFYFIFVITLALAASVYFVNRKK